MSFDVLARDTKIENVLLCEASAGTGKTFTIQHLFIRRILANPQVSVRSFALLTFTNAVAKELSLRLSRELDKAIIDLHAENEDAADYLKPYFGTSAIKVLERARDELEYASIDTFHGFCYSLLSDGKRANFASGLDITLLLEEFLREKIDTDPQELKILLSYFNKDLSALIDALAKDLWNEHASDSAQKVAGTYSEEELLAATYGYKGLRSKDGTLKPEIEKAIYAFTRYIEHHDIAAIMKHPLYASKVFGDPKVGTSPNEAVLFALSQEPKIAELARPDRILKRLAARARSFVSKELKRKNLFAMQELLSLMEEAIKEPSFREKVKKSFSTVVVDEFQDTDPIQWKIIETLFLDDWNGALYLVGDPKQAIYAFRKADVYCYMQARSHKRQHVVTLSTNYRSTEKLVDGLNSLFYRNTLFELPKTSLFLEVPKIACGTTLEEIKDDKQAIHIFSASGALQRKRNWPTEEIETEYFFPFIAEEIAHLKLPLTSIAILVKDRYQAERVEGYLAKRKIPTLSWRKKSVIESEAHLFLERLLLCLESPRDKRHLTNLLVQKPFSKGGSPCTLDEWAEHVSHLLSLKRRLDSGGLAACIRAFLEGVWPGFTITMKEYLWAEPDFLFDLDYLVELAPYLDILKRFPASERDQLASPFEREAAGVQILTMHASKGLEFDVVFALGSACRNQPPDNGVDPLELDAEKLRQFYVACTRARKRLYLPIAEQLDYKEVAPGCKSPIELYLEKCPLHTIKASKTVLGINLDTAPLYAQEKKAFGPLFFGPLSLAAKKISITSFSKERQEQRNYQKIDSEDALPAGAFSGIILHELLQELRPFSLDELQKKLALTPFEGMEEEVRTLIEQALSVNLGPFSLRDIAKEKMRSELEFMTKDEKGRFVHGMLDLFFEHEGKCYIIDWKSNVLESYSIQALQDAALQNGYDLQAKMYKEACLRNSYTFGGFYFVFLRGLKEGKGVLLYE